MKDARFLVVVVLALAIVGAGPGCSCGSDTPAQDDAGVPQEDAGPVEHPDGYVPDGHIPDAPPPDGYLPDGYVQPEVSIDEVLPPAISRTQDNNVDLIGAGFLPGATVTITNCDTGTSYTFDATVSGGGDGGVGGIATIAVPTDLTREQGLYTVTIQNPDGSSATVECILWISGQLPPTVTNVQPAFAYHGDPADMLSSDQPVAITGTGFESTPNVRWQEVATGNLFDAKVVGFIDGEHLTALCPSESKKMPIGDYYVWVVNPDLLSAQWMVDSTTVGLFKVMGDPPPRIDTILPQSFAGSDCSTQDLVVVGDGFVVGETEFFLVMPEGVDTCPDGSSATDAHGNVICPVTETVSDAQHATINLQPNCPQNGPYAVEAINPDGQSAFYYFIVLLPSSDCHMQAAGNDWADTTHPLTTPRYLFAASTGCDEFGHSFIYAAGGVDAADGIINSVEFSEVNIYGHPGEWHDSVQYLDAANPRVTNSLGGLSHPEGRSGLTMVRVGRHLYAIGGVTEYSNIDPGTTAVAAVGTVEHAFILGYETIPMAHTPKVVDTGGLPMGSWYYRVSAIGAFGEGLASDEAILRNVGGTLEICWTQPEVTATTYNIYRTRASDGRSRSEVLVAAGVDGVDSGIPGILCFVDDGFGALTPAPGRLRGVPVTGGTLVEGTYRYRVSATIDNGVDAPHETLGGYVSATELTATDIGGGLASVQLTWDPVQYAAAYHVYKWDGVRYALFASTADGSTTTLTDDGSTPTATCPLSRVDDPCVPLEGIEPLPTGSLSTWMPTGVNLVSPREGADAVPIVYEDDSDATIKRYFMLVAGGRSSNSLGSSAFLANAESVEVDPESGALLDPDGDNLWEVETQQLTIGRAFFPLVTNQNRNDPLFCPPAAQPPCQDQDGDGYYDCACASPDQMPCDCDDTDPAVNPGADEACANGIDDDCDGLIDCEDTEDCATDPHCTADCPDEDGDGHTAAWCGGDDCCDNGTEDALGCDPDTAPTMHPGATEICGDGIDQNCDGVDPPCACVDDLDGDGHISLECAGDDCCDNDEGTDFFSGQGTLGCNPTNAPQIHPGAYDPCNDGIDQDCDGWDSLCLVYESFLPQRTREPVRIPTGPMSLPRRARLALQGAARTRPLPQPRVSLPKLSGDDARVWVIAAQGLTGLPAENNTMLQELEACELAQTNVPVAGALLIDCNTPATDEWALQANGPSHKSFGHEVVLYGQNPATADTSVSCLYNFAGVQTQAVGSYPAVRNATEARLPVYTNTSDGSAETVLGTNESQAGAPVPNRPRAYYQMVRMNGYVYVIGGHTGAAPEGVVERIQQ